MTLKELRERLGWTQREMADHLGCVERSVWTWEKDDTLPKNRRVREIIRQLTEEHLGDVGDSSAK